MLSNKWAECNIYGLLIIIVEQKTNCILKFVKINRAFVK